MGHYDMVPAEKSLAYIKLSIGLWMLRSLVYWEVVGGKVVSFEVIEMTFLGATGQKEPTCDEVQHIFFDSMLG